MHPTPPETERVDVQSGFSDVARLHPFVLEWDQSGFVLRASHALKKLTGEALIGSAFTTWLPDLASTLSRNPCEEPFFSRNTELALRSGDVPVEVTVLPQTDVGASHPTRLAILRITLAGQNLRHATAPDADFLTAVLDNAPDGVVTLDRCGFINYANPAVLELTGLSREALLDRPVASFLMQRGLSKVIQAWPRDHQLQCNLDWEVSPGQTVALHISSRRLILPSGAQAGHVTFVRDVTDQQRIQSELEEKNDELENYVNTVSHDLRSPLASLLGFSHLLRQDYQKYMDDMGLHFLDRIDQAGHTMEALIEDLLTISKIGELGIQRSWIDPREVLEQLRAELKPQLETKNIALLLPSEPPLVLCDRTRLYQIFSNLIGNAIRHGTRKASGEIRVEIGKDETAHILSVHDNGHGIDPLQHERIFQVFQSIGRRDGDTSAGMGLAIVRKIAALHGGRAWVESQPQQGASFYVSLPHS